MSLASEADKKVAARIGAGRDGTLESILDVFLSIETMRTTISQVGGDGVIKAAEEFEPACFFFLAGDWNEEGGLTGGQTATEPDSVTAKICPDFSDTPTWVGGLSRVREAIFVAGVAGFVSHTEMKRSLVAAETSQDDDEDSLLMKTREHTGVAWPVNDLICLNVFDTGSI